MTILSKDIVLYKKSINLLQEIYDDTKTLKVKIHKTKQDLYLFDTLSARYVRTFDFLENKVLKTTLMILGHETFLAMDTFNKCEKLALIKNARTYYKMKQLRNKVVHEYAESEWLTIVDNIKEYTPILLDDSFVIENFVSQLLTNPDYTI